MREHNLENVQFANLRIQWDSFFLTLSHELSEAYYGKADSIGRHNRTGGWRNGVSSPWLGLDCVTTSLPRKVKNFLGVTDETTLTPEQAKKLFDYLHGVIFAAHEAFLVIKNAELPDDERHAELEALVDDHITPGQKINRAVREKRIVANLLRDTGINFRALLKARFPDIDIGA